MYMHVVNVLTWLRICAECVMQCRMGDNINNVCTVMVSTFHEFSDRTAHSEDCADP